VRYGGHYKYKEKEMGEIAEGIINGDFCQYCGEYLGEGDGFPRTCPGCADDTQDNDEEDD
jgi:hypothetical protein